VTIILNREKLTVLHVATLNQPIKSDLGYGPIELVTHGIDKGLCSFGHRSIVACSGDSEVAGEHYVTADKSIGDYWVDNTPERYKTTNLHFSKVLRRAGMGDIDIVHTHDAKAVEFMYDSLHSMNIPIVLTLHVSAKDSSLGGAYQRWCNPPLSSPLVYCAAISEYQKRQYYDIVSAEDVVYNGIDVEEYNAKEEPDKDSYLFTIGRITRDKGQDKAIEIAKKTGSKLIIAGCVQNKPSDKEYFSGLRHSIDLSVEVGRKPVDSNYYGRIIKPLLDCDKQIIYIGEISSEHKKHWYRHARATLFPIQWGEPFGLVLVESMACGTPIIALNRGAVPEIVVDGKTGFAVDSIGAMVNAVGRIESISPRECRKHVQNNFSIESMAGKYIELYRQILGNRKESDRRIMPSIGHHSKLLPHSTEAA